jgi:hypothetical protein
MLTGVLDLPVAALDEERTVRFTGGGGGGMADGHGVFPDSWP